MAKSNETALLKAVLDYLAVRRITAWRQNQGACKIDMPGGKSRFFRFAGIKGISDIIGLLPNSGRFLAVECKVKPNKLTPDQQSFLEMVDEAGGVGIVAYSIEDVIEGLEEDTAMAVARSLVGLP